MRRSYPRALLRLRLVVLLTAVMLPVLAKAQVSLETRLDTGLWRVTIAAEKSTFIGQYGTYVEPAIARAWNVFWRGPPSGGGGGSTGGGSGGSSVKPRPPHRDFWHVLLPSGKLPADLQLHYQGVVGEYASLMFEPEVFRLWAGLKPRVSVETLIDVNALSGYAPSGFGILTDPTRGYVSAAISAIGGEVALPVWGVEADSGSYALYVGHGWMKDWTYTYAAVQSVFLNLSNQTYFHSVIQTYSLSGEWRPAREASSRLDMANVAKFSGVDLQLQAYGTEHMWTIGATGSLIWRL